MGISCLYTNSRSLFWNRDYFIAKTELGERPGFPESGIPRIHSPDLATEKALLPLSPISIINTFGI